MIYKTNYIAVTRTTLPVATISPAETNVYAVEDHVINCNLSGFPAQITDVVWTPPTTETDGYALKDGIFDQEKRFQVSTLTISAMKLVELRGSAESHTFTCKITVGSNNTTVSDTQTITIFNPSKGTVLLSAFNSSI